MPHDGLHDLGMGASHCQPGPARVPQTMKVDDFAVMVPVNQEIAFLSPHGIFDPNLPPPVPFHLYAQGNANASTQWVRTIPLVGPGPLGVFDLAIAVPEPGCLSLSGMGALMRLAMRKRG